MREKEMLWHLLDPLFNTLNIGVSAIVFHWLWLNNLDKEKEVSYQHSQRAEARNRTVFTKGPTSVASILKEVGQLMSIL